MPPLRAEGTGYGLTDLFWLKPSILVTCDRGLVTEYTTVGTAQMGNKDGNDERLASHFVIVHPLGARETTSLRL